MKHVRPHELLVPDRTLLRPDRTIVRPTDFIPGLMPLPKIVGAAREINPGSLSWTTPGTFSWTVPNFNNLSITCLGAGGGGSGAAWHADDFWGGAPDGYGVNNTEFVGGVGATGGVGQFAVTGYVLMVARGGTGGTGGANYQQTSPMAQAASGTASGGNTSNQTGGGASFGEYGYNYLVTRLWGTGPGGGGVYINWVYGGRGGYGARCDSTYTPLQLPPGSTATITVGPGGNPGYQYSNVGYSSTVGAYPTGGNPAAVYVSWN